MNKVVLMTFLSILGSNVMAETQDVTTVGDSIIAKHRYSLGDNDSKSDATALCFLEAKRKAIEYAGIYVEGTVQITQTDKSRNARSDVRAITSALVSAEMSSSSTGFDNGRMYVDCVVKARVDQSRLKQDIARISANPAALKQLDDQQSRLANLESEITGLKLKLQSASSQDAISLRQERTAVFKEIDKLQQRKLEIVSVIENKGSDVKQLITKGMTMQEVISLVGQPRAINSSQLVPSWNYGTLWINFSNGLVQCITTDETPAYYCPRM